MRTPSFFTHVCLMLASFTAIGSAQAQPTGTDDRVAKLYNLGELVAPVDAGAEPPPSPRLQLGLPEAVATVVPQAATNPGPIARLVSAFVRPALLPNEEVTPIGDRWIVAVCRPEQHAWIDRFLEAAKDNAKNQAQQQVLSIGCRCYSLSEFVFLRDVRPAFAGLGGPATEHAANDDGAANGEPAEHTATSFLSQVLAPGEGTTAFLQGLGSNPEVTSIESQSLTLLPLHVGHVAVINQTAYVRDFDLEVAQGTFIANPIVDVLQDGIVLDAAVGELENGMLGVSLDAHVADLKRPIETHEVNLGIGQKATIQLPNVRSTQIEAAVELAPDHVIVLAPPPLSGKRILFVIDVQATKLDELEAQAVEQPGGKRRGFR